MNANGPSSCSDSGFLSVGASAISLERLRGLWEPFYADNRAVVESDMAAPTDPDCPPDVSTDAMSLLVTSGSPLVSLWLHCASWGASNTHGAPSAALEAWSAMMRPVPVETLAFAPVGLSMSSILLMFIGSYYVSFYFL